MTFMDRAIAGKPLRGSGGGPAAPTREQVQKHNALYDPFYEQDAKMSLKFASKAAFNAWLGQLKPAEKKKYAKYQVEEKDGHVLVYKELNDQPGFQPEEDWLVAVNGGRYTKSRAADRKEFTKDGAYRSTKDHSYSKWRKSEGRGGLSGSNIVAKIVGAVASAGGLLKGAKVERYAEITSGIYKRFKNPLVAAFKAEFNIPKGESPKYPDKDTNLAKIVKSTEFKAALLVSLAASDMGTIVTEAVGGHWAARAFKVATRGNLRSICADMPGYAGRAIAALSRSYNVDLTAVSQEFGGEYGGVVPERRVAPKTERPAHRLGELQRLALTGPADVGAGELAQIASYRLQDGEPEVDETEEF
jgi:hypothetical protein